MLINFLTLFCPLNCCTTLCTNDEHENHHWWRHLIKIVSFFNLSYGKLACGWGQRNIDLKQYIPGGAKLVESSRLATAAHGNSPDLDGCDVVGYIDVVVGGLGVKGRGETERRTGVNSCKERHCCFIWNKSKQPCSISFKLNTDNCIYRSCTSSRGEHHACHIN